MQKETRIEQFDDVVGLHLAGNLVEAEKGYRQLLAHGHLSSSITNNLGLICFNTGRLDEALDLFKQTLSGDPSNGDAWNNLGLVYLEMGQADPAIDGFNHAIRVCLDQANGYNNLGLAYKLQGSMSDAIECYQRAVSIDPSHADAYCNIGNALKESGHIKDAIEKYRLAIYYNPRHHSAYNNLAVCLKDQDQLPEAVACYIKSLELNPDNPEIYHNLGIALSESGKVDAAFNCFRQAVAIRAEKNGAHPTVVKLCSALIELKNIPVIYENETDIKLCRERFENNLDLALAIARELPEVTPSEKLMYTEILFKINNFYLSYQQKDDLPLQKKYVELLMLLLKDEIMYISGLKSPHKKRSGKIRLGVASGVLKNYNASNWAFDWLANLPKDDYEIFAYSLNGNIDDLTHKFAELGHFMWLPFTEKSFLKSLEIMMKDELDILLLPDVGITAVSKIISIFRVAQIQCLGWGHPMSTGSPSMDYYLSSDLMESSEAQVYYSEQLIRLPNLGLFFKEPVPPLSVSNDYFDLPTNRVLFGSVQSLFKYLPQHDYLYPEIAQRVPASFFVFIESAQPSTTEIFRKRIYRAFGHYGLVAEQYVKILPRMPHEKFQELLMLININLDTLGWNGGNTTFFSLAMNCPVVTLPGQFMRGRHSCAMLNLIGVPELIATDERDYINLAAKLANDPLYLVTLKKKIETNKYKLYRDVHSINALDSFFKYTTSAISR